MNEDAELRGGFSSRQARRRGPRFQPEFCRAIVAVIPVEMFVVDMGAGAYGPYVKWMRENGWPDACGIDASPNSPSLSKGLVSVGNLTTPNVSFVLFGRNPEWILFREVGEHIPEQFNPDIFRMLATAISGVLLSWAIPGQRWNGHINCQAPEWVSGKMDAVGFRVDNAATAAAVRAMGRRPDKNLMVFVNRGQL